MDKNVSECLVRYSIVKLQKENELHPPVTEGPVWNNDYEYSQSYENRYDFVAQVCLE